MSAIPPGTTLLPASAGTGKTFRIVDVLRDLVLDEGQDLRRVIVVTFTRAAAGELRERVRARFVQAREGLLARSHGLPWDPPDPPLQEWVDGTVASKRAPVAIERAWAALIAFDACCIDTIHGFCERVLAEAAFEAGAPFATERLPSVDAVLATVVDDFWLRHTHSASPAVLASLDALGIDRDGMRDVAAKACDPDLVVQPADPGRPQPVDLSGWERALEAVQEALKDADAARELLTTSPALHRRRSAKTGVTHAITPERAGRYVDALPGWLDDGPVPGERLPDAVIELASGWLALATRADQPPVEHPLCAALQGVVDAHASLGPALADWRASLVHEVVRATRTHLAEHLRRRNGLTFDELLRRVREPLRDPTRRDRLRAAVRARYDAAVVDEFQDTDPCQWDIFRELFGDRLFLVGDPKQAIYRFRGADLETYLRAAAVCAQPGTLDRNQRTDRNLVAAVQHLFRRAGMVEPMADARIEVPAVYAARPPSRLVGDDRPPLQIRLLPRGPGREYGGALRGGDLSRLLPKLVANDIVRELRRGGRIQTRHGDRPIGPGDLAVLTRSNDQARATARALQRRGVPATVRSDASVFESPVRAELSHVLRAVADPTRTAWVRRALLTDLLGTTARGLVALQADDAGWLDVSGRFRRWRALWDERGVLAALRAVLDEGGVAERLLRRGDERLLADLQHLGELLHRESCASDRSPAELVAWLEAGGPGVAVEDAGSRVETDAEAVQCVTVHSAKGLQYPLVWAPWLLGGSRLSKMDEAYLVVQDPEGRPHLDFGSEDYDELLQRRRDEAFAEDLRLIYVALTRAEHRLVLYDGAGGYWPRPLGWLLHQRDWMKTDPDERWDQVANRYWWDRGQTEERNLCEDLDELAKYDHIAWAMEDWDDADTVERWEPPEADELALTTPTRGRKRAPDRSWGRTSYSGLARQVSPEDPRPELDHDPDASPTEPENAPDPIPLADVPGSARLGHVVHQALEHHDFQAGPDALAGRLGTALARQDLPVPWTGVLTGALQDALHAPLGQGFALADIPMADRWNELDFHLPLRGGFAADAGHLTVQRLAEVFDGPLGPGLDGRWREHVRRLAFPAVRGFLTGSIDLVFRREGRWYLADYKTNRLGGSWADYAPDALREPMMAALYPLQYHLYAVALMRLLRHRVPGFDAERDLGGVFYLFVRGMAPSRPGSGVFVDRPPVALLDALDRALGGTP